MMLKELNTDEAPEQSQWLTAFWKGELPRLSLNYPWRSGVFKRIIV